MAAKTDHAWRRRSGSASAEMRCYRLSIISAVIRATNIIIMFYLLTKQSRTCAGCFRLTVLNVLLRRRRQPVLDQMIQTSIKPVYTASIYYTVGALKERIRDAASSF